MLARGMIAALSDERLMRFSVALSGSVAVNVTIPVVSSPMVTGPTGEICGGSLTDRTRTATVALLFKAPEVMVSRIVALLPKAFGARTGRTVNVVASVVGLTLTLLTMLWPVTTTPVAVTLDSRSDTEKVKLGLAWSSAKLADVGTDTNSGCESPPSVMLSR